MRRAFSIVVGLPALVLAGLAGVLAFGTAKAPPEMSSISGPFKSIDFSDLPKLERLLVAGTSPIAYRRYGPIDASEIAIALHGSTASSSSLHVFAKALASNGIAIYAPDLRGHGETGKRGDVDYAGQPDDDLRVLIMHVRSVHPKARLTLAGFSLGGGLALRNAGNANGALIDASLLLAPMLGPGAPTMKRGDDESWARPHIPRLVVLSLLNRLGIRIFDGTSRRSFMRYRPVRKISKSLVIPGACSRACFPATTELV